MKSKRFVHIYSNIIIVKGAKNAILLDIHRNKYIQVSNDMAESLGRMNGKTLKEIEEFSGETDSSDINQILDHLIEQEIVFLSDLDSSFFPPIDNQFLTPHVITNFVWEFGEYVVEEVGIYLSDNKDLLTAHAEFVFFKKVTLKEAMGFVKTVEDNCPFLESYTVTMQSCDESKDALLDLLDSYSRLIQLSIYDRLQCKVIFSSNYREKRLILSTEKITGFKHCGIVDPSLFNSSMYHFTESVSFNSCLNRKISIDIEGNIKNCPAMQESFGNIKDTDLVEVMEEPEFKKYWSINKDKIHVCKDCEFRYICTDCRAFVDDPEDILSKPLKCGYNPYEGVWSEWSENSLKQEVIGFYGMKDIAKAKLP